MVMMMLPSCCRLGSSRSVARFQNVQRILLSSGKIDSIPKLHHQAGFADLEIPGIVYNDNHLLVVNKPAGWHSVPNPPSDDVTNDPDQNKKCLLSYLKQSELGGGSKSDFLIPLHRLDQPCTGVLFLAKTSKAATRVTKIWKQNLVIKDYLCVVSSLHMENLIRASQVLDDEDMHYKLEGLQLKSSWNSSDNRSVTINPHRTLPPYTGPKKGKGTSPKSGTSDQVERPVHVTYRDLSDSIAMNSSKYRLIQVTTHQGARHMVRALFGQIGQCPVEGDLRYGSGRAHSKLSMLAPCTQALPDKSVALHALRVSFPPKLKLGSLSTFSFQAEIPHLWNELFGISPSNIPLK